VCETQNGVRRIVFLLWPGNPLPPAQAAAAITSLPPRVVLHTDNEFKGGGEEEERGEGEGGRPAKGGRLQKAVRSFEPYAIHPWTLPASLVARWPLLLGVQRGTVEEEAAKKLSGFAHWSSFPVSGRVRHAASAPNLLLPFHAPH